MVQTVLILALKSSILLVVFGLGLHTRWRDVLFLYRAPGLLIRSLLSMNLVMPLVAAGLVLSLDLPVTLNIALLALSMSPVPPLIPNKEMGAGGSAPFAIDLFLTSALLSVILIPLTVWAFAASFDRAGAVAPRSIAEPVLVTVLLPLAAGILVRQFLPALAAMIARPLTVGGMLLLFISALPLLFVLWPLMRGLLGPSSLFALIAMALLGLAVGHLLGGPLADTRTVLALSTTSRHPAIALTVATAAGIETRPALAAILLYAVIAGLVSVPYVLWRKRKAQAASSSMAGTGN